MKNPVKKIKSKKFKNKIYNNIQIAIKMEIEKKNSLKQQSSKFLRETILTSNSYDTKESSTFYQNNHHNSQIERKRSRIGSKLCLLEEQLSIEYEDIVNKINENIEEPNEILAENPNEENKEKIEKTQSEKPRKCSLFSDFANNSHRNIQFYINNIIEKNINVNLLINDDKNNLLTRSEELFTLNLTIDSNITIFELIKNTIDCFNEKFKNENYKYLLCNNYNNYKLKASKKNGSPNTDIPAFANSEKVIKTNFTKFSLTYNENDLILNTKKMKCFDRCIIM